MISLGCREDNAVVKLIFHLENMQQSRIYTKIVINYKIIRGVEKS